jgi:formate hydrogenlyase subunit 3/multisubunit Na+/H+ antiporter MnhD subunit
MKARIRRFCALVAVLGAVTLLICVYGAATDDVILTVGIITIVTGVIAWRLDDRPKAEVPPL